MESVRPAEPAYEIGDLVFAREALYHDGGVPGVAEDALLAAPGSRGVVVMLGHAEQDPSQEIYLVRFEEAGSGENLGPPIGVLPDELTQDKELANALRAGT